MSRNILNNQGVYVNTISAGDGINLINNNTTLQTVNVDISKQSSKTTISDTDLFILEESGGGIKKITGSNMKSEIDTNFWTYSSPSLRPDNNTDNLLLGTSSNSNSRKLLVVGNTELQDLYLQSNKKIISTNNSSDYLQFGDGTLTNNYSSNVINNTLSMGASADINLATGRAITRGTNSVDRITFNSGNTTFGNTGIFNNSVFVKATVGTNSGHVSFFEASDNGTNNIDLHSPETLTHDYNVYLPQNTDTSLTSVYVLSNKNVLGGTNINISNSTTDTITVNLDSTIAGTITFSSIINGSINGNAGTSTKIDSITNSNIVQLSATQVLSNKSFSDMPVCEVGLAVKQTDGSTSGNIRFWDKDNSNYIDLHIEDHAVSGNYNVYLPNDIDETVLLGTRNTQTMINKTLSTGSVWNGNTIPVGYGGTEISSYITGDILYASGTTTLSRLAIGSSNRFLMSNGSAPVWSSFTSPLSISGTSVDLGGLSGFGSADQIIATANDGSNALQYRTLTGGENVSITHSGSGITISSSENYWIRDNTISSFDIKTNSTVNNIALTVPLSTNNTVTTSSTIKATGGLISGTGSYLKYVSYSSQYPLEVYNPLSGSSTYHMKFLHNSSGANYPLIKTDNNASFILHWNGVGDRFEFKDDGDLVMSGIVSDTNSECFLNFGSTILENSFHRNDLVKLKIQARAFTSSTENGYIELIENGTTSNTTRIYFNNAGSAYIFYDGTHLIHTPSFYPSDKRVKKNESLANVGMLATAFDNIDIYKYQYERQYAIDKGADPDKFVYGFIAQNVKENTDNLSSQFSSTGDGESIYPNEKIDYHGDKLVVDDLITVNKTDINLLLWAKVKEQQKQIDSLTVLVQNQQKVIDNLVNSKTFKEFKS